MYAKQEEKSDIFILKKLIKFFAIVVAFFLKEKGNYTYFSLKLIWNIDLHHSNCVQAEFGNSVYIPVEKIFILAKEDNNLINVSLSFGDKQESI